MMICFVCSTASSNKILERIPHNRVDIIFLILADRDFVFVKFFLACHAIKMIALTELFHLITSCFFVFLNVITYIG